jgi:hypothetical protein
MTTERKVIRAKVGLLELAKQLGAVGPPDLFEHPPEIRPRDIG